MKSTKEIKIKRLLSRSELSGTNNCNRRKRGSSLPIGQNEFGFVTNPPKPAWRLALPYRLRAGDIIYFEKKICPVIRVSESAAVIEVAQKIREFTTIFEKQVCIRPKPRLIRISANSEVPILKRPAKGWTL